MVAAREWFVDAAGAAASNTLCMMLPLQEKARSLLAARPLVQARQLGQHVMPAATSVGSKRRGVQIAMPGTLSYPPTLQRHGAVFCTLPWDLIAEIPSRTTLAVATQNPAIAEPNQT
ncbi:hypothetical protein ANO11243_033100 [Dothideomycetidae sp. 11243]|nr:hypothetical protein ANO11243_033100 [fungal sp. No.11243]